MLKYRYLFSAVNQISFKPNASLDLMLKSKFLRKSRLSGKDKQLPSEISVPEEEKEAQTSLSIDINEEKKRENYFKMPTGNSGFKFAFNIDENAE